MTCTHHWVIDTPSGPISNGSCKKCGEVKENFKNWAQEDWYSWDASDQSVNYALAQKAVRMWT